MKIEQIKIPIMDEYDGWPLDVFTLEIAKQCVEKTNECVEAVNKALELIEKK